MLGSWLTKALVERGTDVIGLMRDWVPQDDLCHFVIEAVERVDMNAFAVNTRGSGSPQYEPRMMLALLIYCYANGICSSRCQRRSKTQPLHRRKSRPLNGVAG